MRKSIRPAIAGLACLAASAVPAEDWPGFLGPRHDASVAETIRLDWDKRPPETLWKAQIGKGCASFSIQGDRALSLGNADEKDTLWCLDAATGAVLWKHTYDEPLADKQYTGGPSAQPTIDGDRVYSLSKSGRLACLEIATGKVLWTKHYEADFGGRRSDWGWSASPRVLGDHLLIDPGAEGGSIAMIDKLTGALFWKAGDEKPGYAAPLIFEHGGRRMAAYFQAKGLCVYDLDAKGSLIFKYPWRTNWGVNASNPQYHQGRLFFASGYGQGYGIIDISGAEPQLAHRDRDMELMFQNSVFDGGHVMAVFEDKGEPARLARLDMATGNVLWRHELPGERGSLLRAGRHLVILCETGDLVLGQADEKGFKEIARQKPLSDLCWAPPALANGRLYLRDNLGSAVCLDVRP
ncbi:MAG: PQQ-like beta-propeller repeat protein [Verrucomicrobiae bacterium]|nr:PQQ-like beta-propeller repeat protein [Verrucomicrobiae bacterium]